MNRIMLAASAVVLMTFASCKNNDGVSTMTMPVTTYTMVTNTLDGGEPEVSGTVYRFNFDLMAGNVTVATDLSLSSGNKTSFITGNMPFNTGMYKFGEGYAEVIGMKSLKAGSTANQLDITDFECQLTPMANIPPSIDGLPKFVYPNDFRYAVMHYTIGENYRARTFWSDMTFKGSTTTRYTDGEGTHKVYTDTEGSYRVVMNMKDKKATVILYNIKFAEDFTAPLSNLVLEGMSLSFTANGIRVSGTNITPKVFDKSTGTGTANSEYVFESFDCDILGDLVDSSIRYKVGGKYDGQFTGSYLEKVKQEQ